MNLNYFLPSELSIPCKDLISKILVLKPEDRLSIADILIHPWLTKM
jgi:serine/threonine protein kinase